MHPRSDHPADRSAPLACSLRPVAPPDEGFLRRLYAATRAGELAGLRADAAQKEAFLRQQFGARRTDYAVRFAGAEESVIVAGGVDVGTLHVWRGPAEIRLVNIELLPEWRGRGLGEALIRALLAEGDKTRRAVTLSVRDDNPGALRLYRRLGFTHAGKADGYLSLVRKPAKLS